MSYTKNEFVKRILQDEGQRLKRNQGIEIAKRLKFHTYNLINDRHISVTSGDDMDGQLSLTHPAYQRFLDIKRKIRNKRTNKVYTKRYRIHNRFVMGHYYSIANRLMNELTDDVAAAIKKDFQQK